MNCKVGERSTKEEKEGARWGLGIVAFVSAIFLIFCILGIITYFSKLKPLINNPTNHTTVLPNSTESTNPITNAINALIYKNNFFGRFVFWFTRMSKAINSGSILAILAASVTIGFNSFIMTPLISTMFPKNIADPIQVPGRQVYMNPGQFLIAFIGFILSLILFFFISELILLIPQKFRYLLLIILISGFLLFMIYWNTTEYLVILNQPDCVPIDADFKLFAMPPIKTETTQTITQHKPQENIQQPAPIFGIFG